MSESLRPLRVLTIDGGGIRGVVPLRILQTLEKECGGKRIDQVFDLICGTSTGGIIAILLGCLHLNVATCLSIYDKLGSQVFDVNLLRKGWTGVSEGAAFSGTKMTKLIKQELVLQGFNENLCLSDIEARRGPRVFVTSSRDGRPFLFRNYDSANDANGRSDSFVWEAVRATSAAPLYFPSLTINGVVYCDGGMGCNNPTQVALAEIERMQDWKGRKVGCVVSLGTGLASYRTNSGSIRGLLRYISNVTTDCENTHALVADMRREFQYERFNPGGGVGDYSLSSFENVNAMVLATEAYLGGRDIFERITAVAAVLTRSSPAAPSQGRTLSPDIGARLAELDVDYTGRCEAALLHIKQLQDRNPYPSFVEQYVRIKESEKHLGPNGQHEWTAHRKALYNFWERMETYLGDSFEVALTGRWKYRALEYLLYNELMDVTNYYRWRLDKGHLDLGSSQEDAEYWRRRPRSYERIAAAMVAQKLRGEHEDDTLKRLILDDVKPTILRVLGETVPGSDVQ